MRKNQKMVFLALLVAQALVLSLVERMIPVPFVTPGVKLGLANIITVAALYVFSFRDVFMVVILRIILATIFGGSAASFFYSLAGGLLSFVVMYLMIKLFKDGVSIIGVSVVGAVFHNIGQVIIAAAVVQNVKMALYLPVLLVAGVGTGIFVGITARFLLLYLKRFLQFQIKQ